MAFEIKGLSFNLNVWVFLLFKKKVSHWKIDQDNLCILSMPPKEMAKFNCTHSELCDVVYIGEKLWCIDFCKGTSTVLSLSQRTVIFWFFSLQLLVERLFIIVEFQYDCKLNDAKHSEVKYTKDQLMCYLSKYIEE